MALLKQVRRQKVNGDTGYSGMDYLWPSYMGLGGCAQAQCYRSSRFFCPVCAPLTW